MADRHGPRRLIVVDVGDTEIRLIVVGRNGATCAFGYPVTIPHNDASTFFENPDFLSEVQKLSGITPYISVVVGGGKTMIRLMVLPGQPGSGAQLAQRVKQTLGVNEDYDVVHQIVDKETDQYSVLATAIPRQIVDGLDQALTACRLTPVSLVHIGSALANLSALGATTFNNEGNTAILHADMNSSILSVRVNQKNVLIRQLKQGLTPVFQSISESYGLDEDMTVKLFNSGSFDVSGQAAMSMSGWFHQVEMSLDFVSRRLGGRVDKLFLSGSSPGLNVLCTNFSSALGCPVEMIPAFPNVFSPSLSDGTEGAFGEETAVIPYLIAATEGAKILKLAGGHE